VHVGTIAVRSGIPHDQDQWGWRSGKLSEAHFQAWRDQEAWTAEKYRRFDRGERMPPDWSAPGSHAVG